MALLRKMNMPLYCFAGMFFDFSVYFYWLVIPVMMKNMNASPLMIGAADAITFCIAGICAPIMGVLTDKWRGEILCQIGCILQSISCILTGMYYINHDNIYVLYGFLVLQGIGLAMLWSPDETLIGAESYIGEENKNISYFATLSAFGKAVGFLCGGSLTVTFGNTYSLYFAAILPLVVFIVFPRKPKYKNDETNPKKVFQNTIIKREHPKTFYVTSLIVHLFAYGVIAMISNQYIDYADDKGLHLNGVSNAASVFVGVFLFCENLVQTATFVVLGKWNGWQYKQRYNILALSVLLIVSIGLATPIPGWGILAFSIPMGMVAGYELQANLYYSITVSTSHGTYLGISEFIGEMTYALSPFVCGILCSIFDKRCLHYCNIIMCLLGLGIVSVIASLYKRKGLKNLFKRHPKDVSRPIELEDIRMSKDSSSVDLVRDSIDSTRTSSSLDGTDAFRSALLKVIREANEERKEAAQTVKAKTAPSTPVEPKETQDAGGLAEEMEQQAPGAVIDL